MLIFLTIMTVLLMLGGAVSFPYVPLLFGVDGPARQEARGKLIVRLLLLAPLFALLCLIIAWSGAGGVHYVALLPVLYLLCLWLIRPNKQDGFGPQKRFTLKQQNLDEQEREQAYKWLSWLEMKNSKAYLCFTFGSPGKLQAEAIGDELAKLSAPLKTIPQGNGSLTFAAYLELDDIDRELISHHMIAMIDLAWRYDSELISTEVESELPVFS